MDYVKALKMSSKPYYTLQEAYLALTEETISARQIQKLLQTYDKFEVLEGINRLSGRKIDNPYPYLIGILKNNRIKKYGIQERTGKNLVREAVAAIEEEKSREDRPTLRNPFNEPTTQFGS